MNIGTSLLGYSAYESSNSEQFISFSYGLDIGGLQDSFRYVYQVFHGDGAVVGLVDGPYVTGPYDMPAAGKVGLMLRASLNPDSANVALLIVADQGLVLQQRATAGGATTQTVLDATLIPQIDAAWLKLERTGSDIKAYRSNDQGATWQLLSTVPVPSGFPLQALAGFALSSTDETELAFGYSYHSQVTFADTNSDGIGDGWAMHYFSTISINPTDPTPSGDGHTLLEAYQLGLDPLDYYQAVAPALTIVSGNNQSGEEASFLDAPLKVLVANGQGTPLVNAPVTFTVSSGGGALAEASGGTTQTSFSLRTDSNGHVQTWFQLPGSGGPCTIEVTAGTATPVTFTESIVVPTIEGVAAWWKLDETTGSTAEDASGNSNNGTTVLTPSWVSGAMSNALQLSGSGQYVAVPNSASLQIGTSSFTISAWFKSAQYNLAAPILSKCKTDSTGFHGLYLGLDPSGSLEFRLGANVTTKDEIAFSTDNTFTDNAWHQVVVSVNRSTHEAQIYVDGVARTLRLKANSLGSVSTAPGSAGIVVSFAGATNLNANTTEPLLLGADLPTGQHRFLSGPLDDVRFYNRTLDTSELALLTDSDADGLPDAWEMQQMGNLTGIGSTATPSGDGLTLLQAYQQGINPNDFYHGLHPVLQIYGGNNQTGPSGEALPTPLQVRVLNQAGQPISNAPIAFALAQGSGFLSSSVVRTNGLGIAQTTFTPSGAQGAQARIHSYPAGIAGAGHVTFSAKIGQTSSSQSPSPGGGGTGPTPDPDVAPGGGGEGLPATPANLTLDFPEVSEPDDIYTNPDIGITLFANPFSGGDPTSIILKWDASQSPIPPTYIIKRKVENGAWETLHTTEPGATQYTDSNLFAVNVYEYLVFTVIEGKVSVPAYLKYRIPLISAVPIYFNQYSKWYDFAFTNDAFTDLLGDSTPFYMVSVYINTTYRDEEGEYIEEDPQFKYKVKLNPSGLNSQITLYEIQEDGGLYWGDPYVEHTISLGSVMSDAFDAPENGYTQLVPELAFVSMEETWSSIGNIPGIVGPMTNYYGKFNNKLVKIGDGEVRAFGLSNFADWDEYTTLEASGALSSFTIKDESGETVSLASPHNVWDDYLYHFTVEANEDAKDGDTIQLKTGNSEFGFDTVRFTYHAGPGNTNDFSLPIDESAGPKYRKIALNGLPLADEKPQRTEESDQEREETFVDALTIGVRHSTTDVYIPLPGSDFTLSARRDFRTETWTMRSGLRPHEQPDRPFGQCWSSNLAPNVHYTSNTDPDPDNWEPDKVYVTDETGAVHTFIGWDKEGQKVFFPMPTSRNEQQTPNLQTLTLDTSTTPATFTFKRKYGATLIYKVTPMALTVQNDRVLGSEYHTIHKYGRLTQATDRVGNVLLYEFDNATNLVPKTIRMAGQTDVVLSIQQDTNGLITAVWDAKGNKTSFAYTNNIYTNTHGAYTLTSVTTVDGAVTQYGYDAKCEPDITPRSLQDPGAPVWHMDLASITDPLLRTYTFSYDKLDGSGPEFDHTRKNYMDNPEVYTCYYPQIGMPRNVTKITLPNGTFSTFENASDVKVVQGSNGPELSGQRRTIVTDASSFQRRYRFEDAEIVALPKFKNNAAFTHRNDAKLVCYKTMVIDHGIPSTSSHKGSETFKFNIGAAMALKEITDFSGNVTIFAQADAWTADVNYLAVMTNVAINGFYPDPTSQTNALGNTKTFTYYGESRIMNSVTDEEGRRTEYEVDTLGRRTKESVFPAGSSPTPKPIQVTEMEYGSMAFLGVVTKTTVKSLAGAGDPSWVHDLVTETVLDANGRVAQQIVDPAGLAITTSFTYDANGAKLTATDARGNTTWFRYDERNRLVGVTFADGAMKSREYDACGNKVKEINENGIAVLFQYDLLSRLIAQVRDMNGDSIANTGDITTSFTYNEVNAKTSVTSPTGGVTQMEYDTLQRLIKTKDALNNETTFTYGANSGGTAFDSSAFKPTSTTDSRGFTSEVVYDDLYRPVQTSAEYVIGGAAVSTTQYDKVGNAVVTTDPLNRQTVVTYDALNRPFVATNPDATTTQTFYTSTGQKWKVIDELGRAAETEYDTAGRTVTAYGPLVNDGYGGTARPTTTTIYDAVGNVIAGIDPLGQRTDFAFDARNRKVQDIMPAVYDAESGQTVRPTFYTQYDAAGRTVAVTDARGNTSTTIYDAADRAIDTFTPEVPLPGGGMGIPHIHTTYDASGNALSVTDPLGRTTNNTYDQLNRLLTTTDAANITVSYEYDEVGNRTKVTDGNNHATTFTYDGFKRNLTSTNPLAQTTTFVYNAVNKTRRVDAQGRITDYTYDLRNRAESVVYDSTAPANSARNFTYDDAGNLLEVTEPAKAAAHVIYTYDALNRVATETSGGATHTYTYDLAGNRLQTVYGTTGTTIVSTYDALNRLSTMTEGATRVTSYFYDLTSNILQKTLPNGDTETSVFDAANRAVYQHSRTASSRALCLNHYAHDLIGNVVRIEEAYPGHLANRVVTNTYDLANRLITEANSYDASNLVTPGPTASTTTYTYDNGNNRTTKVVTGGTAPGTTEYTYNAFNQLLTYSFGSREVTLTYDASGNRATRTISGTGVADAGTDIYSYDYENLLIALTNTPASGPAKTYAYAYDYRTRRILRDESLAGGTCTKVVFSGGTSAFEVEGSGSGTVTVENIRGSDYGGGVGGVLYSLRSGIPSYAHANRRGDIVARTDGLGALTYLGQYEAYGTHNEEYGASEDRQRANSKDEDPTGLLCEGFRYRDLETGSFITADPMGFVDGPNVYSYVVCSPWTNFDPEGLEASGGPFENIAKRDSDIGGAAEREDWREAAELSKRSAEESARKIAEDDANIKRFQAHWKGEDNSFPAWHCREIILRTLTWAARNDKALEATQVGLEAGIAFLSIATPSINLAADFRLITAPSFTYLTPPPSPLPQATTDLAQTITKMFSNKRGPVLSGIRDPFTDQMFFAQNFPTLPEKLVPFLRVRCDNYKALVAAGKFIPGVRCGIIGAHSEIYALNQAMNARILQGLPPIPINQYEMYNVSLLSKCPGKVVDRCDNCRNITWGINVLSGK